MRAQLKTAVIALALLAAFAAGHYQGIEQGWQEGFNEAVAKDQKMYSSIIDSLTQNADEEQEEIDPADSVNLQRQGSEWQLTLQTPACSSVQNLQVIWPKGGSSAPLEIECDDMKKSSN